MKKMKFMGLMATAAMISTMSAAPVFAAETSGAETDVTYTANSASSAEADWLVSYPSNIVLSDYNDSAQNGESLSFKLMDKFAKQPTPYTGNRTVSVTVDTYTAAGIDLVGQGAATGTATMAIADFQNADLNPAGDPTPNLLGTMKAAGSTKANVTKGKAYIKSKTDPDGTFTASVTFTFTDDNVN